MIEPPEFLIMEVDHDDGERQWRTVVPCETHGTSIQYRHKGSDEYYDCFSASNFWPVLATL